MKKIIVCMFTFITAFGLSLFAQDQPSVIIVGGGPAGLATAIEAHQKGAHVTILEKRESYSRMQVLFLEDSSLKLLGKWKVAIPQMRVADIGEGQKIGFIQIKVLEKALETSVKELGIRKLLGEFRGFKDEKGKTVVIATPNGDQQIPYDILVGADGMHSHVRERLGIESNSLGTATGAAAALLLPDPARPIGISAALKLNDYFIRKITAPFGSVIFCQTVSPPTPKTADVDSQKKLEELARECGWEKEAALIAGAESFIIDDIEIVLQQAQTFSDTKRAAILVGDAAATASFIEGRGVNTAFKTAALAGDFFQKMQEDHAAAYGSFNQAMKETTNEMIDGSRFLFTPSSF